MAKMARSGEYAREGKFGPANDLLAEACAEIDGAVAASPDVFEYRSKRGMIYSSLPRFLNKYETGRKDLEFVIAHPAFKDLSEAQQKQMRKLLDQARSMSGPTDRFPNVSDQVSPVIAAATVTMPSGGSVAWMADAMRGQPGLLGTHILNSADKPGMIVILSWWKDKAALNGFFYSDVHQGMIRQAYDRKPGEKRDVDVTQVGIEVFTSLPGGTRIGGGLTPEPAAKR